MSDVVRTLLALRLNAERWRRLPRRSQVVGARTFLTALLEPDRRLKQLERAANASPQNAAMELGFVRELNEKYPDAVVQRYESGKFQEHPQVKLEYVKALHKLGRTPPAAVAASVEAGAAGRLVSGGGVAAESDLAAQMANMSARSPLHVKVVQGWQGMAYSGFWTTARWGIVAFLVVTMVGALMDERTGGVSSRMGGTHQVHSAETSDKRFNDVMGVDEAKSELQEIVMYLKNPTKFTRLGGQMPRGVLLMGPPGTGKTLLARAIAGEAGVPFFYASGSEFEEMYVGVGARRMRDMFEAAKKRSPCIIFIDEIDAVGSSRQLKEQQAMKMTLNQLLVEMDGFEQNKGIIVIGATNYADVLDDALLRPGRFDRHVTVPLPDIKGRRQILELYTQRVTAAKDLDLDTLARGTPGMSGAELFNLVNQAALKASLDGAKRVCMKDFEYAKDKILMGAERKSAVISPETARLTAYHEGGHALVAIKTAGADPIHKATIMPRGQALGMVMQLPAGDQTSMSRQQMLARLDVCMGGRVAEEMIFGPNAVTSGASSDIRQATQLARSMVMHYGMSDEVGVVFHSNDQSSPEMRALIDKEVQKLLNDSYQRATKVLATNRRELEVLAKALLEHETLSSTDITDIISGRRIKR
uniref:AAA+ ATPase domain-containing protein n=1 Tax=Rhizochromulina marina TaxID=1034831 RepID=A0A7S2WPS6_9STRA